MSKFKKGDRVRTKGYEGTHWDGEGVVTEGYDGFCILALINGREGGFSPHELAPAPLQLEAGKFYRTRDGRKVGPCRVLNDDDLDEDYQGRRAAYYIEGQGSYTLGGVWLTGHYDCADDLIAEWVDEPQEDEPVAAATQPKFKVGDRVSGFGFSIPYTNKLVEGVVSEVDQYSGRFNYRITLDSGDDCWLYNDGIELRQPIFNATNTPTPTTGFTVPLCAYEDAVTTTALGDAYVAGYKAGLAAQQAATAALAA